MKSPIYVLDTHALVWFVKGRTAQIGLDALVSMLHPRARIVVPSHVLSEVHQAFSPKMDGKKDRVRVPPTPLLRLMSHCSNVRVLPRGPATLAWEFKLKRENRSNGIDDQDIAIAASVLATRQYYNGPVALISNDARLAKWARVVGVPLIWNQRQLSLLPT